MKKIILIVLLIYSSVITIGFGIEFCMRYTNNASSLKSMYKIPYIDDSVYIKKNSDDEIVIYIYDYYLGYLGTIHSKFSPDDCFKLALRINSEREENGRFKVTFEYSNGMIITFDTLENNWISGVTIDSSHATGDVIPCISNFSEYRKFERYEIYGGLLMFGRLMPGYREYGVEYVRSFPDFSMLKAAISKGAEIVTDEHTLNEVLHRTDSAFYLGEYTLGEAINLCSEELGITPNLCVSTDPLRNYSEVDRNDFFRKHLYFYAYMNDTNSFSEVEDDKGYYHTREFLTRGLIFSSVLLLLCLLPLIRMRTKKVISKKYLLNNTTQDSPKES